MHVLSSLCVVALTLRTGARPRHDLQIIQVGASVSKHDHLVDHALGSTVTPAHEHGLLRGLLVMRLHRLHLLVPFVNHLVYELGGLGLILLIRVLGLLLGWDVPVVGGR